MTAAEHRDFWEAREREATKRARKKRGQSQSFRDADLITPPLHRRENLMRFLLIEEFAQAFPRIPVIAQAVEQWDQEDLEDFRAIRVARHEVGRKHDRYRKASAATREALTDMMEQTELVMAGEKGDPMRSKAKTDE